MDREFEIEELEEKIKFLVELNTPLRAIYKHCKNYEGCSKKLIKEKIKEGFSKRKRYSNGKPVLKYK